MAFQVGQGAPTASLLWDSASLDMSLRVWKEKISMVLYIRNLDEETFASKVYKEQKLKKMARFGCRNLEKVTFCILKIVMKLNKTFQSTN